jgi:hypothetical protein
VIDHVVSVFIVPEIARAASLSTDNVPDTFRPVVPKENASFESTIAPKPVGVTFPDTVPVTSEVTVPDDEMFT